MELDLIGASGDGEGPTASSGRAELANDLAGEVAQWRHEEGIIAQLDERVTAESNVEYGVHLPLIDFGGDRTLPTLKTYVRSAATLGYRYLCANDHLTFSRPWLDGPVLLSALLDESGDMTLATTASLPVLRGPVQLAKTLATIDVLSGGRLAVGVGPGSSASDYAAAGLAFDERWPRFDEAVQVLRALLRGERSDADGEFYSLRGVVLEPHSVQQAGPPIWIASWGSPAGLRRVARLADGWLASAYNTTPDHFRDCLHRLSGALQLADRSPESFFHAIATTWLYVTDDRASAERMLTDLLAPMLNRSAEQLRTLALPIGPPEVCAERLTSFIQAGARRIFLWPLRNEVTQLELFRERVIPLLPVSGPKR